MRDSMHCSSDFFTDVYYTLIINNVITIICRTDHEKMLEYNYYFSVNSLFRLNQEKIH